MNQELRIGGGDPGLDLIDALYAFAAEPDRWPEVLAAVERLPPGGTGGVLPAGRLSAHVERATALAERLSQERLKRVREAVQWDAVLLTPAGAVVAHTGEGLAALVPHLEEGARESVLNRASRPSWTRAVTTAASVARAGVAPIALGEDGSDRRCHGLVLDASAIPPALASAFGVVVGTDHLALVLVGDADLGVENGVLREVFGFTPAEWRLAARLRSGLAIRDAAEELGISVHTARTQLRAIFAKAGVKRQSDLVRKLAAAEGVFARLAGRSVPPRSPYAPDRRYVDAPGGRRIAYRAFGREDGHPVLVFHSGLPANAFLPEFAKAAQDSSLRVIAFDRPGYGRTSPVRPYDINAIAADVKTLVHALGAPRVSFIASGIGAIFASACARAMPGKVTRIAMLAPRLGLGKDGKGALRSTIGALLSQPWLIRFVVEIFRHGLDARIAESIARRFTGESAADRRQLQNPHIREALIAAGLDAFEVSAEGLAGDLTLLTKSAAIPYARLEPALRVWQGAENVSVPLAETKAALDGHRDLTFTVIPGEGTLMSVESMAEIFAWLGGKS